MINMKHIHEHIHEHKYVYALAAMALLSLTAKLFAQTVTVDCLAEGRCQIVEEHRIAHAYEDTKVVCLLNGNSFTPNKQVRCGITFRAREDVVVQTNSNIIEEREQKFFGEPVLIKGGKVNVWISGGDRNYGRSRSRYITIDATLDKDNNPTPVFAFTIATELFLGNGYTGNAFRRRWDNRPVTINWQYNCENETDATRLRKLNNCKDWHEINLYYQTFEGTGYFDDWEYWDNVYQLKKDFTFNGVDQYFAQYVWSR